MWEGSRWARHAASRPSKSNVTRIEDPVDLTIDNKVIAKGELVETEDGSLGVKITEIPEQSYDDLG